MWCIRAGRKKSKASRRRKCANASWRSCHRTNNNHFKSFAHQVVPRLVSEKTAAMSTDDLRNLITNGKGHMPKYGGKLTPEEIDTLVQQIQALNKK